MYFLYTKELNYYKGDDFLITVYVKELDEEDKSQYSKIKLNIVNKLNLVQSKLIDENKKIYLIPNIKKINIYKKILRKLEREKTITKRVQLVLSKQVKNYEKYFSNCKIVDGKSVFFNSIENILSKILQKEAAQLQDIYILTNNYQEKNINLIRNLASKVKTVNVVTKQIEKYKILEAMMEELGVPIVVTNNKRKSLRRAKIIINLDFTKEEICEYIIFRDAVIINLTQENLTSLKGFLGITIQDIRNRIK